MTSARERLIFALDVPDGKRAEALARRLAGHVGVFKVGLELFSAEGPGVVRSIVGLGGGVFLDLKLHDIPTTVERAAAQASRMGARFLTVHASGGKAMIEAACRGAREGAEAGADPVRILAVTVLTSLDEGSLKQIGLEGTPASAAVRLAALASDAGAYGIVSSAREAAAIRAACRPDLAVVTPGIRPAGAAVQDQSRAETPAAAIEAGADYLVVGRPIRDAERPETAADEIVSEMGVALSKAGRRIRE